MLDCHTASFRLLCILIQYMTLILNNCIIFIEFKKKFGNTPLCQRSCALLRNWRGVLHACISSTRNTRLTPHFNFRISPAWQHSIVTTEHKIKEGGGGAGMGKCQSFDRSRGLGPRALSQANFENWNCGKYNFLDLVIL